MITIKNGDPVPDSPSLQVIASDGQYNDVDLILCGPKPGAAASETMYQAQYLRYGPVVYQHETPEALGEAILSVDPESTHDAAQIYREELQRKMAREKGSLEPEKPVEAPDAIAPEPEGTVEETPDVPARPEPVPDEVVEPVVPAAEEPSGTYYPPQVLGETLVAPPVTLTEATSTPSVVTVDPVVASSTPAVIDTPAVTPAVDLSTTTPE